MLKVKEKAELINGRIVRLMATGHLPNTIAGRIYRLLADFVEEYLEGVIYTDNIGFAIDELPSGRESFSPDVSYYDGPLPENLMRFIEGAPTFAVEVRSEGDYSPAAEREMTAKRADYFAAGTRAVWDVDPTGQIIRLYVDDPVHPVATFLAGDQANAEPAVPGWRLDMAKLFR
ncbi:MAG TPA: Uma2 family endonuclease [Gemmatales bacterium]|nr:Uma2 family endonuclease [Gemmatales bacterium]